MLRSPGRAQGWRWLQQPGADGGRVDRTSGGLLTWHRLGLCGFRRCNATLRALVASHCDLVVLQVLATQISRVAVNSSRVHEAVPVPADRESRDGAPGRKSPILLQSGESRLTVSRASPVAGDVFPVIGSLKATDDMPNDPEALAQAVQEQRRCAHLPDGAAACPCGRCRGSRSAYDPQQLLLEDRQLRRNVGQVLERHVADVGRGQGDGLAAVDPSPMASRPINSPADGSRGPVPRRPR